MKRHFFATFIVTSLFAAQSFAHIRMTAPTPRSTSDALKTAPCGGVDANGTFTRFAPGATAAVKFEETVGHEGCYQVAFSKDGSTYTVLAQYADPAGAQGMQTRNVKLPTEPCSNCVLQLRQIMANGPCGDAGFQTPTATDTYYSCADICIGDTCPTPPALDAGSDAAPMEVDASAPPVTPPPVTTRPDAGESRTFDDSGGVNDGCNAAGAGIGSGVFVVLAGLLLRRRQNKPII